MKRRRKWISLINGSRKQWTPSKYSVMCSMHRKDDFTRAYFFDQQCYQQYQRRLKRDEIDVVPVPRFYRPKVEQEYSTGDYRLHRRSVRFISPLIVEMSALDQSSNVLLSINLNSRKFSIRVHFNSYARGLLYL